MRCMLMMCTPMRCTPMRCIPMRCMPMRCMNREIFDLSLSILRRTPSTGGVGPSVRMGHPHVNHVFLISWWNDAKTTFPSLHLYALDTLSMPDVRKV